jgi:LCP family protein required for cell wall assembly
MAEDEPRLEQPEPTTEPEAERAAVDQEEKWAELEAAQPHPRRSRKAALIGVRTAVSLVAVTALGITGYAWTALHKIEKNTNTTDAVAQANTTATTSGAIAPPPANDGSDDILLVGEDSRNDAQGNPLPTSILKILRTTADGGAINTDTMIILHIPKNGAKPSAISIPRDSFVDIPGYRKDKINAAFGVTQYLEAQALRSSGLSAADIQKQSTEAAQAVLIQTVQNLTGLRIDHYAEINLYGFYLLSQAIGGVDVCLKAATKDKNSGADFRAGYQSISGSAALSFVRQRDNLPRGDLDRIVRQQTFLGAAAKKLLSANTLANPTAIDGLANTVKQSLIMDPGLDVLSFLKQAQSMVGGNINFVTIPVVNANARSDRGQSIVQVDPAAVKQYVATLSSTGNGRPAPRLRTVDVGNPTPTATPNANDPRCIN